jgi:nitrite reductase (NO-forming)
MNKFCLSFIVVSIIFVSCGGDVKTTSPTSSEPLTEKAEGNNKYAEGESIYNRTCVACHQKNGEGLPNIFPPLKDSDYLLTDKQRAIEQILNGSQGEIIVNGKKYNGVMPPQILTDEQVRDVLNYSLNNWGNNGGEVTLDEVKSAKHPS